VTDEEMRKKLGPLPTRIGEPGMIIDPFGLLTRSDILGIIAERDAARAELAAVTAERDALKRAIAVPADRDSEGLREAIRSELIVLGFEQCNTIEGLRAERDDLLRAFEPLLIEVEPLRYAKQEQIERAVAERKAWADKRCCLSYHAELRNTLEREINPLIEATRAANEAFDRVAKAAGLPPTPGTVRDEE
jgi:hypothetical protein